MKNNFNNQLEIPQMDPFTPLGAIDIIYAERVGYIRLDWDAGSSNYDDGSYTINDEDVLIGGSPSGSSNDATSYSFMWVMIVYFGRLVDITGAGNKWYFFFRKWLVDNAVYFPPGNEGCSARSRVIPIIDDFDYDTIQASALAAKFKMQIRREGSLAESNNVVYHDEINLYLASGNETETVMQDSIRMDTTKLNQNSFYGLVVYLCIDTTDIRYPCMHVIKSDAGDYDPRNCFLLKWPEAINT